MSVTRILYFLTSYSVFFSVIKAYQPDGYLGCFEDFEGDSLESYIRIYQNYMSNKGDFCKDECKNQTKRYAGTKEKECYCGSGVAEKRNKSSTECKRPCPGNPSEICGGKYNTDHYNRISLYDTWQKDTTTSRLSPSSSRQGIGSTTVIEKDTTTTYSISPSSSRQGIGSTTVISQPSDNKLAIYLAVSVSVVVLFVFVLIVTVLILRKRLSRNKDGRKTVYQNSANTGHPLLTVANNAYNDPDIIPLETTVNVHATEDAATGDSDHNYYTLEQTGDGNRNYNNSDQRSGSAIDNDDNSYGHLHVRSAALCDPTYSHMTKTGPQGTTDNTYSHMDLSAGNKIHEVMSNVDQDTYNTCNMMGDVEKLRPAVGINDVDDTYNRLAISGNATIMGEKHSVSGVNEPEYDHTDMKNP